MKRLLFLVCLALAFPFVLQAQTVTIATLDWPPYVGSSLKAKGFNSEIITEAFKRAGHTVKIEFMDWDTAIDKASQGKYDAVFPEYYSKDREKAFIYSNFFSNSLLVFYKRKDTKVNFISPTNLKDLAPYKIGVVKGYINTDEFDKATYLKKVESDSDEASLKKLVNKEVDLIVIDKLVAQHIIKRDMPAAAASLEAVDHPLVIHPLFMIFPKKNPNSKKLCDDFNKGLEAITKDGTVKAIMSRSGLL